MIRVAAGRHGKEHVRRDDALPRLTGSTLRERDRNWRHTAVAVKFGLLPWVESAESPKLPKENDIGLVGQLIIG